MIIASLALILLTIIYPGFVKQLVKPGKMIASLIVYAFVFSTPAVIFSAVIAVFILVVAGEVQDRKKEE
jgi:predicted membrane protein